MPIPNNKQATSQITRKGRILAERPTGAGRGQAPAPFMHSHPANRDSRENARSDKVPAKTP